MNHASIYCKTLARVTKAELVNALHQALMQLNAAHRGIVENLDHRPAINEAGRVLGKAGHPGFRATPVFVTRAAKDAYYARLNRD